MPAANCSRVATALRRAALFAAVTLPRVSEATSAASLRTVLVASVLLASGLLSCVLVCYGGLASIGNTALPSSDGSGPQLG